MELGEMDERIDELRYELSVLQERRRAILNRARTREYRRLARVG